MQGEGLTSPGNCGTIRSNPETQSKMDPSTPQTVKMRDVIERLDTPERPFWESHEEFFRACNVDASWVPLEDHGFTIRPIHIWTCTDTEVGHKLIYLDGEPICASYQAGRKCDVEYAWVSREAYEKARAKILSLIEQEMGDGPAFLDMEAKVNAHQRLFDLSELLCRNNDGALLNGEPVEVLAGETARALRELGVSHYGQKEVVVRRNGEEQRVAVKDLVFPLKLRSPVTT